MIETYVTWTDNGVSLVVEGELCTWSKVASVLRRAFLGTNFEIIR